MSYTPTEWKTGDVVTSAKLNKLEAGVSAAGGMVVHAPYDEATDSYVMDKTANEILTAMSEGVLVWVLSGDAAHVETGGIMFGSPILEATSPEEGVYTFHIIYSIAQLPSTQEIVWTRGAFEASSGSAFPTMPN